MSLRTILFVSLLALFAEASSGQVVIFENRKVFAVQFDKTIGRPESVVCSGSSCAQRFFLEGKTRTATAALPSVQSVVAVDDITIRVELSTDLVNPASKFVYRQLEFANQDKLTGKPDFKPASGEVSLGGRIEDMPGDPRRLIVSLPTPLNAAPTAADVIVTVTDLDAEKDLPGFKVRSIIRYEGENSLEVVLSPTPPPGPSLAVGLEATQSGLAASGKFKIAAPSGRDDAAQYVAGSWSATHGGKDAYGFDLKLSRTLRRRLTSDTTAILDIIAGSDALKLADAGSLSVKHTRWLTKGEASQREITNSGLVFQPIYRSDKKWDNQDVGLDVGFEPFFRRLYWPVERRKLTIEKAELGWTITPTFYAETGVHVRNESGEVEDQPFLRLRPGIVGTLGWRRWKASASFQPRFPLRKELHRVEDDIIRIDRKPRPYVRAEIAREFYYGLSLSAVHMYGGLPPAFERSHATTFSVVLTR
jgi:hypothetical protein